MSQTATSGKAVLEQHVLGLRTRLSVRQEEEHGKTCLQCVYTKPEAVMLIRCILPAGQ